MRGPVPRRVAVLMGGQSGERDVSLMSGETVALRLASDDYRVKPVAIHADGSWEVPRGRLGEGLPLTARDWFSGAGLRLEEALLRLREEGTDVVFIALHGPRGEDGTVQGLLEVAGLPYTGPEVTAAALAMDKRLTKEVLRAAGIPTPRSLVVGPEALGPEGVDWGGVLERGRTLFPFPWVLKPNRLGSSLGVLIVRDRDEFLRRAPEAGRHLPWAAPGGAVEQGGELLVEEFVEGRELTCGVVALGGAPPRALPPIEIRPRGRAFFDYQAKYTPGATEEICPAPLAPEVSALVEETAVAVHRAVGADPLSRTDFILRPGGRLEVLEINTIPGMTATSLIPLSAGKAGLDLGDLFRGMVEHALRRAGRAG